MFEFTMGKEIVLITPRRAFILSTPLSISDILGANREPVWERPQISGPIGDITAINVNITPTTIVEIIASPIFNSPLDVHYFPWQIDGITPGTIALDINGNPILDAKGQETIVNSGLYREIALGVDGKPIIDGSGNICLVKNSADMLIAPEEFEFSAFSKKHYAWQVEYVRTWGQTSGRVMESGAIELQIGTPQNSRTIFLNSRKTALHVVEYISRTVALTMENIDQKDLNTISVFQLLQSRIGLSSDKTSANSILSKIHTIIQSIDSNIAALIDSEKGYQGSLDAFINSLQLGGDLLDKQNLNIMIGAMLLLYQNIVDNEFHDISKVSDEVQVLEEIYSFMKAFSVEPETPPKSGPEGKRGNVCSLDNNRTIKMAFRKVRDSLLRVVQNKYETLKLISVRSFAPLPYPAIGVGATFITKLAEIMFLRQLYAETMGAIYTAITEAAIEPTNEAGELTKQFNLVDSTFPLPNSNEDASANARKKRNFAGRDSDVAGPDLFTQDEINSLRTYGDINYTRIALWASHLNPAMPPIVKFYNITMPKFHLFEYHEDQFKWVGFTKTAIGSYSSILNTYNSQLNHGNQKYLSRANSYSSEGTKISQNITSLISRSSDLLLTIVKNLS